MILIFWLRPNAEAIVDFYRNFTVDVTGVGDVCSFAQMDVRKHGNPEWQAPVYEHHDSLQKPSSPPSNNFQAQAENGKTELSLIHFTHMNPDWRPPYDASNFLSSFKERAVRDAVDATNLPTLLEENPLLSSLSSAGGEFSAALMTSFVQGRARVPEFPMAPGSLHTGDEDLDSYRTNPLGSSGPQGQSRLPRAPGLQSSFRGSLSRHEGPFYNNPRGVMSA